MVKTRSNNHKRVFSWFVSRRPQTPAEASLEASLEILRPQGAGRPCYEAERTPLAVENSVGKPAAYEAPNVGTGKRAWRTPTPKRIAKRKREEKNERKDNQNKRKYKKIKKKKKNLKAKRLLKN
jgi:hypothetical protein